MRAQILALMLALSVTLGSVASAQAHRLNAACRFLPGRMVRVETWFDNGDTPRTGDVLISTDGGDPLVKGRLSSQGLFLFDAPQGQALQVVVEAGEGHRAEVAVKPGEVILDKAAGTPPIAPVEQPAFPIKDVLLGIGLLLAGAAFMLSLRNARRLRELRSADR